jgi:hypothetical protein
MLAFDSRPIMSSFMRLGGGLLCLGVAHFLKLLGASMELNPKLDVSAISNYVLQFLSDFVCLPVLWAFVIEAFFSEAWNSERKMIDMHSTDGSVSEGDRKSKENISGMGHNEVSDKMSSWNRGRGLKGGNNNGGYNGRVGRLNNGNRYIWCIQQQPASMAPQQCCFQQSRIRCHSTKVQPAHDESRRLQISSHLHGSIHR